MKWKQNQINVTALLLFVCLVCQSCGIGNFLSSENKQVYQYRYQLSGATASRPLRYKDENVFINFKIDDAAIRFRLTNRSNVSSSIEWDKVSVGIMNRFHPIRHYANLYSDNVSNAETLIPPGGHLYDMVIPHRNVYFDGTAWKEKRLLPELNRDRAKIVELLKERHGSMITLVLPVLFHGTNTRRLEYRFEFEIVGVDSIDIAQKPYRPKAPTGNENGGHDEAVTATIVASVMLGVSVYILSQKKSEQQIESGP